MPSREVMTLSSESIGRFRDWLSDEGKLDATVRAYCSDLTTMLRDTETESVSMAEFESKAKAWLRKYRPIVAPKTTTRRLTSLKTFATWAGWGNPFEEYRAPKPEPSIPHPLPEGMPGVRSMIEVAAKDTHRALVAMCGLAGLRISEALISKPSDWELHQMQLKVHGKGGKIRYVPIQDELWSCCSMAVTQAFIDGDRVIVNLHDRAARKVITRLAVKAQLKRHVKSHDLRATYATGLLDAGVNIRVVQELLGHESVETTQIYTGVKAKQLRDAVNKI